MEGGGTVPMRWYLTGLGVAVAAVVGTDRVATSDDASQVVLLLLLVVSAALGAAAPRRAWLSGLVVGAAIGVAHLLYVTVGPALPVASEPSGVGGAASLLVLIVPAMIGAYLGAGAVWLLRRS